MVSGITKSELTRSAVTNDLSRVQMEKQAEYGYLNK